MNLTKKFSKSIWLAFLFSGLSLGSIQNISAQEKSQTLNQIQVDEQVSVVINHNNTYTATNGSESKELPQRNEIKLRYQSFDPITESPEVLSSAIRESVERIAKPGEKQAYIVQFVTQAFESYQIKLKELGCDVYNHIPYHALLVHMDADTKKAVEQLSYVRWVGDYYPDYKLDSDIMEEYTSRASASGAMAQRYSILLCQKNGKKAVKNAVIRMGGKVNVTTKGKLMEITVAPSQIVEIAGLKEVLSIDKYAAPEEDMDIVREIGGANYVEQIEGYTGQGVRFEVMDGGLYDGHENFNHKKVLWHTSKKGAYHGTCVSSIVWGNGKKKAKSRGIIPDCEQPIMAWYGGFSDRYKHTKELVNPKGKYRASFQTNSWGQGRTKKYTTVSAAMDELIFDHDILIFQSQSNAGTRDSRPEAWAKNVVSVGGIRHYNTIKRSDDKWNKSASIGPASDGRIKPDLAHFYDYTYAASEGTNKYKEFGGTSGATPITAGYGGLLMQMWADGVFDGGPGKNRDVFDSRPHMTTARALLINSAYQYDFNGTKHDKTRVHQGWGMVDVKKLYNEAKANDWSLPLLINESKVLKPLDIHKYTIDCDGKSPLKITMVYADPEANPSASIHRINDLSLKVISPTGKVYWGNYGLREGPWSKSGGTADELNLVENVIIQNPEKGTWKVEVHGDEIVVDSHKETAKIDADYALVATGAKSSGGTNPKPPAAPTSLNITVNSCSKITLKWNDVANNETSYQVIRRIKGTSKETTYNLGANEESYVDTKVAKKTVYQYKVQASNSAGKAATAWKTAAETPDCGTEDIEITDIVTRCNSEGKTVNEIYFTVNIPYTEVKSVYGKLTDLGGNNFRIVESNVGFNTKLDYIIKVNNGATEVATKTLYVTSVSSCNSVKEYTITASVGANGSISPSGAVKVNEGESITFNISANSGYIVDDVLVNGVSIGSKTKYTFSNVKDNHTIKASFKKDATGNAVTITGVVTDCNKKQKARNIIFATVSVPHSSVTVNRGYVINLGNGKYKVRDVGMAKGSTYGYKITAKNGSKVVGTASKSVKAVTSCPKSTMDIENAIADIQIYPIPANDLFTILLSGFENADVSIYSVDGRLVYNKTEVNEQLEINASGWSDNIYIIKVTDSVNVKTHKLVME
ncbi:MAG: S8 family serine peptidase [Bacteroidales bacterium]|nr:S8 family serine peptidase [Bacteroidales bacterium]